MYTSIKSKLATFVRLEALLHRKRINRHPSQPLPHFFHSFTLKVFILMWESNPCVCVCVHACVRVSCHTLAKCGKTFPVTALSASQDKQTRQLTSCHEKAWAESLSGVQWRSYKATIITHRDTLSVVFVIDDLMLQWWKKTFSLWFFFCPIWEYIYDDSMYIYIVIVSWRARPDQWNV